MEPSYDIVTVFDAENLIDGESYQRRYRTRDERPLMPGYYVVLWDAWTDAPTFDERAVYCGPYLSYGHAQSMVPGLLRSDALGSPAARGHGST